VVGIFLMALLGGLGGGITRDILVDQVPAALTNPPYITLSLAFGCVGYFIAYATGQLFREGVFQFVTVFALALYAIVGVQRGVDVGLPVPACLRNLGLLVEDEWSFGVSRFAHRPVGLGPLAAHPRRSAQPHRAEILRRT
jgi:hypothetical protein